MDRPDFWDLTLLERDSDEQAFWFEQEVEFVWRRESADRYAVVQAGRDEVRLVDRRGVDWVADGDVYPTWQLAVRSLLY